MTTPEVPIVCDMTDAPDTPEERLAAYHDLFADALIGRERTEDGIRFHFRPDPGVEDRVRRLAALEHECCAFIDHDVELHGDELWWSTTTIDDPIAKQILDQLYVLPDTVNDSVMTLYQRFADEGLTIIIQEDGIHRPATEVEIGLPPR